PNGRRIVYTTYVDATEMHALQENIRKAEEGARAKNDFLFNISHDIRTPMNAIMGYAEILEKEVTGEDEKRYLSKLMDSTRFLNFLLANAIELSALERGIETPRESPGNVTEFNKMMDAVLEKSLAERNLTFTRNVNISHKSVMSDSSKLRIVFLNIISNAIKFTPPGGRIHVDFEEMPSDREGYALYRTVVEDTGIGIDKKFLPFVFDDFAREKNSTASGSLGAGIGLSVAKKLVELMGGTITLESEVGKGTRVEVVIPHRIVERDNLVKDMDMPRIYNRSIIGGKRILLAEDNDLNAEIEETILTDIGFVCERARDGKEAVEKIKSRNDDYFSLILMDIQMPCMDGYEATKAIRRLGGKKASIPIIAITANALERDRRLALASGMDSHISKPIDVERLLDAVFSIV
ncbi:MAG: hybrid sensor histidine kinase/response regulator, partial [Candidatus Ornithospirochaeta sp.]